MRRLAAPLCAALLQAAPLVASAQPAATARWTSGATCYEVFVRSFKDSDGDGIGDLKGLIQRLDYINDGNPRSTTDLGARCIWLMPVAQSPSYHGYDVTDYYTVERDYGTNADFKRLVTEAHKRGIRVLVDLVLNHASSQHPYFQEALRDTTSPHRSWFRFARTKPNTKGPWGQEVWHRSPVRDEYFYGVFYEGMPDLNYETPAVRQEADRIARFWLTEMGVDGFRLDAVPYLVEKGDSLAHTSGTHAVLHDFARGVKGVSPSAYMIGEVWDSAGTILSYYPDQLDAYFAFPASDAILDAVRNGSARNLLTPFVRFQHALPPDRWAPFLRNHDQTRTLTSLGGDVGRARLAATLLLTLPGLPFVYYGEEIGMTGDKPDERIRTPMQWTGAANGGFTSGQPWEPLQNDVATSNVETERADPGSLLNLYRRLIHLRGASSALGSGTLIPLVTSNDAVAAYLRRDGLRAVLVVANLGGTPVSDVSLASEGSVLTGGRYTLVGLLGEPSGVTLNVPSHGWLRAYKPVATLEPRSAYVFELRATH